MKQESIIKGVKTLVCTLLVGVIGACDKAPNDGNLDGNWQLVSVQENAQSPVREVKSERLYLGFRRGIAEYYCISNTTHLTVFAHYNHTSDSLFIYHFANAADDTNPYYTTTDTLRVFYINNLSERYGIEHLDDDAMWLTQGEKRLHYRKF
jgi:hypothetical protein